MLLVAYIAMAKFVNRCTGFSAFSVADRFDTWIKGVLLPGKVVLIFRAASPLTSVEKKRKCAAKHPTLLIYTQS